LVELDIPALGGVEFFDFEAIALADPVLFATGLDHSVHRQFS
jgi:hypothetical protein